MVIFGTFSYRIGVNKSMEGSDGEYFLPTYLIVIFMIILVLFECEKISKLMGDVAKNMKAF